LNEDLVKTQESEILINKLDYVDIVESLVFLNDSYTTKLEYDLSLLDTIVDMLTLHSDKVVLEQ
jgi:hypothetical protein